MGRLTATRAKIVWCGNESIPEMVMPEPIDHDARGQRMAWIGEPIGEFPAALGFRGVRIQTELGGWLVDGGQCSRSDDVSGRSDVAAFEQAGWRRLLAQPGV